jgi:uncharacterized protein with NAD-binding domain and iron-sulfur cluster
VSALSEELDRISISAASQVVRESMKSPQARQMGVPMIPLTDLYNAAGNYVRARGGEIHFRCSLENFAADKSSVRVRVTDSEATFDYLIAALPFDALARVLPDSRESADLREKIGHFENSPITGIHLWFDRQISDLDHAVLLDRTIQWMFHKSRLQPMRMQEVPVLASSGSAGHLREDHAAGFPASSAPSPVLASASEGGSYIELVVSASKTLIGKTKNEIVEMALAEVREFFPAAREANLIKSAVVKEVNATYSPRPGIDAHRPNTVTEWPRVLLAGDWTATGWPATMEGAVRSGYLAAEALTRTVGAPAMYISPDLPTTGLMRLFG